MDWLKEHLGEELYAQLVAKLQGNDKVKLANLVGGEYVSKLKFEDESRKAAEFKTQLQERDKQLEGLKKGAGDNEALAAQIKELQTANETAGKDYQVKLAATERDFALKDALKNDFHARDVLSVMPHLKQDAIMYKDGTFTGLKEQVEVLSKDKAFLFGSGDVPPVGTGGAPFTPPQPSGGSGFDFGFTAVRNVPENK